MQKELGDKQIEARSSNETVGTLTLDCAKLWSVAIL